MLRKISSIDFKSSNTTSGKTVLIRVDYNVPVKNERVLDDYRILKSIPTIKYCLEKGSKVVLMSHMGRPDGKVDNKLSLIPAGEKLAELLEMPNLLEIQRNSYELFLQKNIKPENNKLVIMAKYVLMGRYSSQFSEGMIHTQQDRIKVVEPMLQSFGIELKEFLFIPSNPENDFVAIVEADPNNEMKLHGGVQMVYATGTFEKINAFRAFNSGEMRDIFQIGHDGISSFVSARQGAGLE